MVRLAPLIESIPEEFRRKDRRREFVTFLNSLPLTSGQKRRVIVQWARTVGAVLTRQLFEDAGVQRLPMLDVARKGVNPALDSEVAIWPGG